MKPLLRYMAECQKEANRRVLSHCEKESSVPFVKVPIFFRTIHATVCHIAVVNELWLHRIQGSSHAHLNYLYDDATPKEAWGTIFPTMQDASRALLQSDLRVQEALEATPEEQLNDLSEPLRAKKKSKKATKLRPSIISFRTTEGVDKEQYKAVAYLHIFNHATHHRGQIHAAFTTLGKEGPVLDIPDFNIKGGCCYY